MRIPMNRVWIGLLAAIGMPALLQAQVPQQQQALQQQQQQAQAQALQRQQRANPPRDVIAKVNGDPITETELNINLQRLVQSQQAQQGQQGQPGQLDAGNVNELREQALHQLIESRLVEQFAIEEGPEVDEQEVEQILEGAQQQVRSQGMTFDQFLASRGHTRESLEKRIEGSLAWQKYQESQATNEKLRAHFEENKNQFPIQDFEQARPLVMQSYAAELWSDTVREASEDAEIELAGASEDPRAAEAVGPYPTE